MCQILKMPRSSTDIDEIEERPLPMERTEFWAGSIGKVEVMRQRMDAGEQLYHPFDCKLILVGELNSAQPSKDSHQSDRIRTWIDRLAI